MYTSTHFIVSEKLQRLSKTSNSNSTVDTHHSTINQAERFLVCAPMASDFPPEHFDGCVGLDGDHLLLLHRLHVNADHAFRQLNPRLLNLLTLLLLLLLLVMVHRGMVLLVLYVMRLLMVMSMLVHLRLEMLQLRNLMVRLQVLSLEEKEGRNITCSNLWVLPTKGE